MAINFPSTPALNQVYTNGDRTWTWNGRYWKATSTTIGYTGSGGATTLSALTDVDVSSAVAGQVLGYTGSNWVPTEGGGAPGSFYINLGMTGQITTPFEGNSKFYPPKNVSMLAVYANLSLAATSAAFTFIIKKNGVDIGTTFTIAQNQTVMTPTNINVSLLTTDYITLDVTGATATDLFVKIEYINT